MSSKKRRLHDPHTVSFLCKLNYNEKKFLFKISEDQTCEEVFEKAKMHVHNYSENKNHGNHDLFLLEYYIGQDVFTLYPDEGQTFGSRVVRSSNFSLLKRHMNSVRKIYIGVGYVCKCRKEPALQLKAEKEILFKNSVKHWREAYTFYDNLVTRRRELIRVSI